MLHEAPSKAGLLREVKSLLKPDGRIYIIEPKFHVSSKAFEEMTGIIENIGLEIVERPTVFLSRAVLLKIR
jgi:hypothetical protein